MDRLQVIDLLKVIKRTYPLVDVSAEAVDHYCKYLRDFPYEVAIENLERHIKTERFPPTIADIRGRLGDQLDSQRSKADADAYFAQVELWRRNRNPPPPVGYWESMRAQIKGGAAE